MTGAATTGPKRSQSLPDVPTVAETGLPGYELTSFIGVMGPKGLPQPIGAKLSAAMAKIAASREFRDFCATQGIEVDFADSDTFTKEAPAELERWRKVIAISGAKAE